MRPVPTSILLSLLAALCLLCVWQWHRETLLRNINTRQLTDLTHLQAEREDLDTRLKSSDAEILRLTGSVNELRVNSVAKPQHDEVVQANAMLREQLEKANAALIQQNEAIQKQNAAIAQANESIKTLTSNRDDLAKRLNEITALYNKLAKAGGAAPAQ